MTEPTFTATAYFVAQRTIPTSLIFCAISGGPQRYLKIHLDLEQPTHTFARQCQGIINRTAYIRFYGRPMGYIINYAPDHAVHYNVKGEIVETLDHEYSPPALYIEYEAGHEIEGGQD
jgi:hypothetical protein